MNVALLAFYLPLGAASVAYLIAGARALRRARGSADANRPRRPTAFEILVGFVVAFFDTLGIGSFAPTTAILKLKRMVADELIPGTLNVGLTAAALTESILFVRSVPVNPVLLVSTVVSSAIGAWLGAGIVARLPRRAIQFTMGIALLIAGTVFAAMNLHALPGGGNAMTLLGWKFGLAVAINFVLGALMSAGIGLYAPCMITLALLGMAPLAAFPIMMGSCALLQPVASLRFLQTGAFGWGAAIGLTVGGIGGVLVAFYIVKQLDLEILRWLVILVVAYAAFAMLRSALRAAAHTTAGATPAAL